KALRRAALAGRLSVCWFFALGSVGCASDLRKRKRGSYSAVAGVALASTVAIPATRTARRAPTARGRTVIFLSPEESPQPLFLRDAADTIKTSDRLCSMVSVRRGFAATSANWRGREGAGFAR